MTAETILIVEDEALIARDLQFVLEDLRYAVAAVATTAGEALAHIHTAAPDSGAGAGPDHSVMRDA
jgi:CheY-like chemotaxis protein